MPMRVLTAILLAVATSCAAADTIPHFSVGQPCYPRADDQTICVPKEQVREGGVFFLRTDGLASCVGKRIGVSMQRTAFDEFKAIAYRAEGCKVQENVSYFGVFGETPQPLAHAVPSITTAALAKAMDVVSCMSCQEFAKVNNVVPVVAGFGTDPSLPIVLRFPIKSYAEGGREVGPLVLLSNGAVTRFPGWCNTRPLLLQFAHHRAIAYLENGCENGELTFRVFDLSEHLPLTVLEDGRYGT